MRFLVGCAPFGLVAGLLPGCQAPEASRLAELPLARSHRAHAHTSFERNGGNVDHGHAIASLGEDRHLLAEETGPGRITRIWSANPSGHLTIEVDGEAVWDGPFAELLSGQHAPFTGPLCGPLGGGFVSYLPIPFRTSLRVVVDDPDFERTYYQIHTALGPEPRSFEPQQAAAASRRPVRNLEPPRCEIKTIEWLGAATGDRPLLSITEAPGEVHDLAFDPGPAGWTRTLTHETWLDVHVDGQDRPTISAPCGMLFGVGFDAEGLETDVVYATGTTRHLALRMPFRQRIDFRLRPLGVTGIAPEIAQATLACAAHPLSDQQARRRGLLHARPVRAVNRPGVPFELLSLRGCTGHLVGAVFDCAGAPAQALTFLEGDELLIVDGDLEHAHRGTGTEDDIGGAWYFRGGPFGSPFVAVSCLDPVRSLVSMARFRIADPVRFDRSIHWTTEHGGANDAPGSEYRALVFWYQHDGPTPPAPDDEFRRAWALPQAKPQAVEVAPRRMFAGRDATGSIPWPALPELQPLDGHAPLRVVFDAGDEQREVMLPDPEHRELRLDSADFAARVTSVRVEPWLDAIRSWRLAGPFRPSRERAGVDEVFGPEQDASVEARYAVEGDGPRGWFPAPTPGWTGYLDLMPCFTPRDHVVGYAATVVESPRDQDAVLVLGTDDATQVFLDGREVHRVKVLRGAGRDQDRVPVKLRAGAQLLLIKVENYLGGYGLYARFEASHGLTFRSGLD